MTPPMHFTDCSYLVLPDVGVIEHPRNSKYRGCFPRAWWAVEEQMRKLALFDRAQEGLGYLDEFLRVLTACYTASNTSCCAATSFTSLGLYFSTQICALEAESSFSLQGTTTSILNGIGVGRESPRIKDPTPCPSGRQLDY